MSVLTVAFPDSEIKEMISKKQDVINDLYKSYFDSRYFDEPFTKNQVDEMKKFVISLKEALRKLWN